MVDTLRSRPHLDSVVDSFVLDSFRYLFLGSLTHQLAAHNLLLHSFHVVEGRYAKTNSGNRYFLVYDLIFIDFDLARLLTALNS